MEYLIIGNGPAGIEAATAIRQEDPAGRITMVTESRWLHYNRPKLVHYLAQEKADPRSLLVHDESWYERHGIENHLSRRMVALDTGRRVARDHFGKEWAWDRLLIATGASPVIPAIPGIDKAGVFTLRSLSDADRITLFSETAQRITVLGGGLLGLENAWALHQRGKEVRIIESAPHLLPRQLDAEGAAYLTALLKDKGLEIHTGVTVSQLIGERRVRGLTLGNGQTLETDAVLVSTGVKPQLDWLQGSGITVNRGIVVDQHLATSVPHVWAAGDTAEFQGQSLGLWTVARAQGTIAGMNMAGRSSVYEGFSPSTLLKITGIPVFSMGDPRQEGHGRTCQDSRGFSKIIVQHDRPVSAMVVGDMGAVSRTQKIMNGKAPLESFA